MSLKAKRNLAIETYKDTIWRLHVKMEVESRRGSCKPKSTKETTRSEEEAGKDSFLGDFRESMASLTP